MQHQADDDGKEAVGHPVGRLHTEETGEHALGAADPVVLEQAKPGQRQHPRRHHVGDHHKRPEHAFEADVGAHQKPRQGGADADAQNGHTNSDGDAVEQRLNEQRLGKRAGEDAFEMKERKGADFRLRPIGKVITLIDQGVVDDFEQGHQHQETQDGEEYETQNPFRPVYQPIKVVAEIAPGKDRRVAFGIRRIQRHVSGLTFAFPQAGGIQLKRLASDSTSKKFNDSASKSTHRGSPTSIRMNPGCRSVMEFFSDRACRIVSAPVG